MENFKPIINKFFTDMTVNADKCRENKYEANAHTNILLLKNKRPYTGTNRCDRITVTKHEGVCE